MVEAAEAGHLPLQLLLAGVAERRMAEVVGERDGLGEIGVEAHRRGERAGDLRHLQRVGQPGAVLVALVGDEHLGLLLQAPERRGVDDAVAVAGEGRARAAVGLRIAAPREARQSEANGARPSIFACGRFASCAIRGSALCPSRSGFSYKGPE